MKLRLILILSLLLSARFGFGAGETVFTSPRYKFPPEIRVVKYNKVFNAKAGVAKFEEQIQDKNTAFAYYVAGVLAGEMSTGKDHGSPSMVQIEGLKAQAIAAMSALASAFEKPIMTKAEKDVALAKNRKILSLLLKEQNRPGDLTQAEMAFLNETIDGEKINRKTMPINLWVDKSVTCVGTGTGTSLQFFDDRPGKILSQHLTAIQGDATVVGVYSEKNGGLVLRDEAVDSADSLLEGSYFGEWAPGNVLLARPRFTRESGARIWSVNDNSFPTWRVHLSKSLAGDLPVYQSDSYNRERRDFPAGVHGHGM